MACYNDCSALNLSTCEFTEEETSIGVVSGCSNYLGVILNKLWLISSTTLKRLNKLTKTPGLLGSIPSGKERINLYQSIKDQLL